MIKTLVLYYSRDGHTRRMANQIARGVTAISGCEAMVRTVPELKTINAADSSSLQQSTVANEADAASTADALYVTKSDLEHADALIAISPQQFLRHHRQCTVARKAPCSR